MPQFSGIKLKDRLRQEGPFELWSAELDGRSLAVRRVAPDLAEHGTIRTALAFASSVAHRQVAHENVVHCHGLFTLEGVEVQISESPPQLDLEQILKREAIEPRLGTWIIRQLAEAIIHAESQQVAHNNLMPRHVYLAADGVVRLDFGVMRSVQSGPDQTSIAGLGDAAYEPVFMKDGKLHPPADVYALAAIWFELLTGRRYVDVLRETRGVHPSAAQLAPGLSASIDTVLARALDGAVRDPFLEAKTFSAALARVFYVDLDATDDNHGARALAARMQELLGVANEPPPTPTSLTDPEAPPPAATMGAFTRALQERARPVEPKPLTRDDHDSSDVIEPNRSTWAPGISIPAGQNPLGPQPIVQTAPVPMITAGTIPPSSLSTPQVIRVPDRAWPTWAKWFLLGFVLTFLGLRVLHS